MANPHPGKVGEIVNVDSEVAAWTVQFPPQPLANNDRFAVRNTANFGYTPITLDGNGTNIVFPGSTTPLTSAAIAIVNATYHFVFNSNTGNWEVNFPFANPMTWHGDWQSGRTYPYQAVVRDGAWCMVANKQTEDRPAPQPTGSPFDVYTGASPTSISSAKQIIFGNRYIWAIGGYLQGYRIYTVTGNIYRIFQVADPLGVATITQLVIFEANSTGWQEFPLANQLVSTGTAFDLVAIVNEPDPSPTIISADWDYDTPNAGNPGAPVSGMIQHHNKATDELRVHKTPSAGGPVDLSGLTPGDIIDGAGVRWSIQAISDQGTYWIFTVAPASQGFPDGVQTFNFETTATVPLTRMLDTNYWSLNPPPNGSTIQGLYIEDGDYGSIVPDNNAYGTDLKVQGASVSEDWDAVSYSG